MLTKDQSEQQRLTVAELEKCCPSLPSSQVIGSLNVGLTHLRNILMVRAHDDVQRQFGMDSMIIPATPSKLEMQARRVKVEIEAYSSIVVDDEVTQGEYVERPREWFLDWIFKLRLGEGCQSIFDKRVEYYRSKSVEDRRLKFVSMLNRVLPESYKTPLILYRLFPTAVRIVTAVAYQDPLRAQELRAEQCRLLPPISDCHECHGRVLDNEEICRCCSNPLWKFSWLNAY
jgi:hypothetical protein